MNDLLAILISFVYVFLILGAAEGLRRAFKLEADFTRKVVHIGVGMWAWGTAALFTNRWAAIVPPAAFVAINYLSYRYGLFMAMESKDKSNLGTVYFPIAFVAAVLLFFDTKPLFLLTLMPLTWGDPFAAIVGRRFGRHHYTVLKSTRSLEGSFAMLILSFLSAWGTLILFGSDPFNWVALLIASAVATLSTLVEAISPFGLDNLLIPAASALGTIATVSILSTALPGVL